MLFSRLVAFATALAVILPPWSGLWDTILSTTSLLKADNSEFETWLNKQSQLSISYILENIGGISAVLDQNEVPPGVVIASPLRKNPDYFFTWTRDSALTIRTLVHYVEDNVALSGSVRNIIELYIEKNYHQQRLPNRSGKFDDKRRSGLGEPKFLTTGEQFNDDWGRPQSDGPAIRASTIIAYLDFLKAHNLKIENTFLGNASFVFERIVKPDLEYVSANWDFKLFDLWEEVDSVHFFNLMVQIRAVSDGIRLALERKEWPLLNQLSTTFDAISNKLTRAGGFTLPTVPFIIENPELRTQRKRNGLDSASLLAAVHGHDADNDSTNDIPFDVDDSHVLNTIYALVADMKYRYSVNHERIQRPQTVGVALGRYPEDVYDGVGKSEGNPWFLTTLTAAEVLYRWVAKVGKDDADLVIPEEAFEFFAPFVEYADLGQNEVRISRQSPQLRQILKNVFRFADTFVTVARTHLDKESGRMLEQFNKYNGYMQGAKSLTWSYSAFYNANRWRTRAKAVIGSDDAVWRIGCKWFRGLMWV